MEGDGGHKLDIERAQLKSADRGFANESKNFRKKIVEGFPFGEAGLKAVDSGGKISSFKLLGLFFKRVNSGDNLGETVDFFLVGIEQVFKDVEHKLTGLIIPRNWSLRVN